MTLSGYAARLQRLSPRNAFVLCFISGALMAFCFAPLSCWPLAFLSLPTFYLALEGAPSRGAALWRGFAFGYGYFMAGTWWIANAMLVDLAQFGWLIPLSILGLSAVFALWFMLLGWLFWWRRTGSISGDLLRFAVLWVVVEYARSIGIFGFPWNLAGYIALVSLPVAQVASLIGTFGLSLLVVLLALLPALWLKPTMHRAARVRFCLAVLALLAASYGYGVQRIPAGIASTKERVRLVQPAIPQAVKWSKDGASQSTAALTALSQEAGKEGIPPIIIWPESAIPFTLYPDSKWVGELKSLVPPGGVIVSGVVRADDRDKKLIVWNSLVAIDDNGRVAVSYDKHQLVPFGEFVPLRSVLPLDKITPGDTDFSRGPGPQTLVVGRHSSFSPLICYEAIFPWAAVDPAKRPGWLLNVTNDGWYGDSPGPYQHFAMARMRSIEQGLPLARAANNGISAMVDPYGRVVESLPLDARGVVDAALPESLPATPYARYGEGLALVVLLATWLLGSPNKLVRKINFS